MRLTRKTLWTQSPRARLRGQGLVEAALVIPVLFVLLLLTVNGALVFRAQMTAEQAAAEGARYAALHEDATEQEIVDWTRASVGIGPDCQVSVTSYQIASQGYTMTVMDNQDSSRSAEAINRRYAHVVTVRIPTQLVGINQIMTAASSHSAITSEEGVQ